MDCFAALAMTISSSSPPSASTLDDLEHARKFIHQFDVGGLLYFPHFLRSIDEWNVRP